jgi:hypothetical protein
MAKSIAIERFTTSLFEMFDETFEQHHGFYLDKKTSLFETLASISAAEASIPVGGKCATIAAQVEHVRFYLDVLGSSFRGEEIGKVDWGEIWRTVSNVTPAEWDVSKKRLADTYHNLLTVLKNHDNWEGEDDIGDGMAMMIHTAYHLGEIRQALCFIR